MGDRSHFTLFLKSLGVVLHWVDRIGDCFDWIEDNFLVAVLSVLTLMGLATLAMQTFLWAATGSWPTILVADALPYLGMDLLPNSAPAEKWKGLASIGGWFLSLPLSYIALIGPTIIVGLFAIALPALISKGYHAYRDEVSGRAMFRFQGFEAVEKYRRAAEQGDGAAQNNLGIIYRNGWGATQDYIQAHMWFNIAAATHASEHLRSRSLLTATASTPSARDKLRDQSARARDKLAKRMRPDQVAEAQRLARVWIEQH